MHISNPLWFFLGLATSTFASFNAYALYDHEEVSAALGITSQCLTALNHTVECDANSAARAARSADEDYWYMDNITSLCTTSCAESLSSWLKIVEDQCLDDQVTVNGLILQPKIFPLRFIAGYDLACIQDSDRRWCFFESQDWESSAYTNWDRAPDACFGDNQPVICDEEGFSIAEGIPEALSVTNIYDKELYCSECFLLLWRQRLLSPVLPPGNLTEYLVDQFVRLEDDCSTTMPLTTSSPTLILGTSNPTVTTTKTSDD